MRHPFYRFLRVLGLFVMIFGVGGLGAVAFHNSRTSAARAETLLLADFQTPTVDDFSNQFSQGARLFVRQELSLDAKAAGTQEIPFQGGKAGAVVEFFGSPRCYLRLKPGVTKVAPGQKLRVGRVENSFKRGHGDLTVTIDGHDQVSQLNCYSNTDHALTLPEWRSIVGGFLSLEKS